MKRLVLFVLCLLLAFYVGWPLWSAMQLHSALKAEDTAVVERRIDFPSVRASMRPAIQLKVAEIFDKLVQQAGPGAALIATQLKGQLLPQIVETTLATLVTAPNVIRIANDAGPLKERIERIIREHMGKVPGLPGAGQGAGPTATVPGLGGGIQLPGGLGQIAGKIGAGGQPQPKPAAPVEAPPAPAGAKQGFGLANVKRVAFTGPLSFEVGLAKDAAAAVSDVTAQMGFTGFDWKLIGLVPKL